MYARKLVSDLADLFRWADAEDRAGYRTIPAQGQVSAPLVPIAAGGFIASRRIRCIH